MYWLVYIFAAILLALLFSKGSAMDKGWATFFSICFTPIIGIAAMLFIGKYGNSRKKIFRYSEIQKIVCFISALAIMYLIYTLYIGYPSIPKYTPQYLSESDYEDIFKNLPSYKIKLRSFYIVLIFTIGLVGNVIYLISNADTYIKDEEVHFEFEKEPLGHNR